MSEILVVLGLLAQSAEVVTVSGTVFDPQNRPVPAAVVKATDGLGRAKVQTKANAEGHYSLSVPAPGPYAFVAEASGFDPVATELKPVGGGALTVDLALGQLAKAGVVMTVTEKVVEPTVDQRDGAVFQKTLFTRDDQIFQTLGAGLSLGQHAGGGKSLEVRRFGFNLDHGGVGGGLRVLIDDLLQNQVSGGHAHGYLGSIKGLSPELVESVNLINGPFNAQYGDFSGLGVVNIRTRAEMPDKFTGRVQFGQYNTRRIFGAFSPEWRDTKALLANEYSYSDGPFQVPLNYFRDNLTGALIKKIRPETTLGFRFFGAINQFNSAGQLPVDQVEAGNIDRFGFIDPSDGGDSRAGTFAGYLQHEQRNGAIWKFDGMVQRMLFDLYSNFTFFLNDPVNGDAFGQHDSRLQYAGNAQYQKQHLLGSGLGTFVAGANYLQNDINLKLYGRIRRVPTDLRTWAYTNVTNGGGYAQENMTLFRGHVQLGFGARYDDFAYTVTDQIDEAGNGRTRGGAWQPKASFAYTPWLGKPLTLHANYGRAITSTNARALIQDFNSPRVAKTDFYQFGTSHNKGRFSAATNFFWIDRSNELIYVADDGSNEFVGPSRNYGFEAKTSVQLTRFLTYNGSITKVLNAFYRGTAPREYVDRAPHFTAYSALTLTSWKGWTGSLRLRAVSRYRLNGEDATGPGARVPGHTLTDFSMARQIWKGVEFNLAIDNIFDKRYFETFEMYTSRLRGQDPLERVHGTPGYPRTVVAGLTFRLFPKKI